MEYTIQDIAKQLNLTKDTLRYYEKLGLVCPKRKVNGYRYYDEGDIEVLQYIGLMKYAKFTLKEMQVMLSIANSDVSDEQIQVGEHIILDKIAELEGIVKKYQSITSMLKALQPLILSRECSEETNHQIRAIIHNACSNI